MTFLLRHFYGWLPIFWLEVIPKLLNSNSGLTDKHCHLNCPVALLTHHSPDRTYCFLVSLYTCPPCLLFPISYKDPMCINDINSICSLWPIKLPNVVPQNCPFLFYAGKDLPSGYFLFSLQRLWTGADFKTTLYFLPLVLDL